MTNVTWRRGVSVVLAVALLAPMWVSVTLASPAAGAEPTRSVMLLLDGSGSISPAQWRIQLDGFEAAVTNQTVVPRDGSVAVGVVQWSGTTARTEIPLTTIDDQSLSQFADELVDIPQIGGLTNPGDGIRHGTDHLVEEDDSASDWTLCLSTDGVTNSGETLASATAYADSEGVDRLSVLGIEDAGVSGDTLRDHYEPHLIGDGTFTVAVDTPDFAGLAAGCFADPLRATALEITQGLQDWNNSVELVAGRDTVARAFVETVDGRSQAVTGRLHGARDGAPLPDSPLTPLNHNGLIVADGDATSERDELASSLNFALPDSWVAGDVDLALELPSGAFCDLDSVACPLPETSVAFAEADSLDLNLIAVEHEDDDGQVREPSLPALREQGLRVASGHPFPDVDVTYDSMSLLGRFNPVSAPTTQSEWIALLGLIDAKRTFDGCVGRLCDTYYYALLDDAPSGTIGMGSTYRSGGSYVMDTGGRFSTGRNRNLISHEIGHMLGQDHAVHSSQGTLPLKQGFCNEDAAPWAPDWPHLVDTHIGEMPAIGPVGDPATEVFGFDARFADRHGSPLAVVDPYSEFALMSYCAPLEQTEDGDPIAVGQGRWHGLFTWERVLDRFNSTSLADTPPEPEPGAVLMGTAEFDVDSVDGDRFAVESIDLAAAAPVGAVEVDDGPFEATGFDTAGAVVGQWRFDIAEGVPHSDEDDQLAVVRVPAPGLDLADLATVEIRRDGDLITTVDAPDVAPQVDAADATVEGDRLVADWDGNDPDAHYLVQVSDDDGQSWQLVGLGDHEGARVGIRMLAGGAHLLRTVVSSGISATVSDPVEVTLPERGPMIVVDGPDEDRVFVGRQRIRATATAFAPGEGVLPGDQISWESDVDGPLGVGETLDVVAADLSEGAHVIAATATDADGATDSDSFTVMVSRAPVSEPDTPPRDLFELLRDDVQSSGIDRPAERSFVAKLDAAIAAIDRGRDAQACGPLDAFVNQVDAHDGDALDPDTADDWMGRAGEAAGKLDC